MLWNSEVTPVQCPHEEVKLTDCSKASSIDHDLIMTGVIWAYTNYTIFITMHSIIKLPIHGLECNP